MIYSAFGLGLAVSQPIPRLAGAPPAATADVRVELNARPAWFDNTPPSRIASVSPYADAAGAPMRTLREFENGWLQLSYIDGTDFLIDPAGTEVWATWRDGTSIDDMSAYLLGPVMGFVLRLRGRVCLHGSGVLVAGCALAIIGPAGAGKSTMAGAFSALGYPVLSDDVLPVVESDRGFTAGSGYPRVRLWPEAMQAVSLIDPSLPELPADWGERRYHLNIQARGTFHSEPAPLSVVYVLADRGHGGEPPRIESMRGEDALMALVEESFAATLFNRQMRAQDLDVMSRVAATVPVRVVHRPHDLSQLPQVCAVILADFQRIVAPELTVASS